MKYNTYSKPIGFQNATLTKIAFEAKKINIQNNGCWNFDWNINKDGYGVITFNYKNKFAHRAFYELFNGKIPQKMVIDHTCHNISQCEGGKTCLHRRCVNPKHLVLATIAENNRSGNSTKWQGAKTHCPRGHEYNKENTYLSKLKYIRKSDGKNSYSRICKICAWGKK